jgi:hypothetical protein
MASGEVWFRWGAALVVGALLGVIGSTVNPWSVVGRLDALEDRMDKMERGETTPISKVTMQRFVALEERVGRMEAKVDKLIVAVAQLRAKRAKAEMGERAQLPPFEPLPPEVAPGEVGG